MMFRRLHFACVLSLVCIAQGCASSPTINTRPVMADVVRTPEIAFPVPIVELRGDSAALGRQHGERFSDTIHTLHQKYLHVFLRTDTQWLLAATAATAFEAQVRPEHRDEVQALAAATGISESDTMLGQCFLDLSKMTACSTIALPPSASRDGVARFGRNLDFPSLGVAEKYTTLFIVHPSDGRYAFAAVGWPGMIGVLSGMNEHGLVLANMEVTRAPRLPSAMPYTLLYRTLLERCRTVDEAVAMLRKTPIQTANNLMLMDAAGNRAVAELSPSAIHVRYGTTNSALISTNHQRDQDVDTSGLCWRYDYLHATARNEFGSMNESSVEQMLAHVGGHATMQAMVFEPANRVIYLSAGADAAKGQYRRMDLRAFFMNSMESAKP